jgi:CYTH domain-containing protein
MSSHMEIERRFLVDGRTQKPWRSEAKSIHNIEQYYLQASNLNLDADGYLCLSDVIMIRPFPNVQKTRYCVVAVDDFIWEIDEFEGELAGLILAEVELPSEQQPVELPPWIGLELTGLRNWSNAALAETLMANL